VTDIVERRFLLMKRGLYYRPDNCGYTGIKDHAGRYLAEDARPDSGVTAIHEDEAPDFSPACFDDLAREHLQQQITRLRSERDRLQAELSAIKSNTWCWFSGDGEHVYDYPLEWAEYELDHAHSPCVHQFSWAGRLPDTWAVFTWAGDEDDGEWNVVEYESEEAARTALSPACPEAPPASTDRVISAGKGASE
jgi:hypothetical protein